MAKIATPTIKTIADSDITENSIKITWDIDSAATGYKVDVTDGGASLAGYPKDATMPDNFTATGLSANKEYGFKIQALDANDATNNSDWSAEAKATTKAVQSKASTPLTWKTAPKATTTVEVGDTFTFETPVAEGGTAPITVTHSPQTVNTSSVKTVEVTYTATDSSNPAQTLEGKTVVTVKAKKLPKVTGVTVTNVAGDATGANGTGTLDWNEITPKPAGATITYWGIYDGGSPWQLNSKPYHLTSLTKGNHKVQVQVRGDGTNYLNGDPSDEVTFAVPAVATPMAITIPGGDVQNVEQGKKFTVPTATVTGGTNPEVTSNVSEVDATNLTVGATVQVTYTAHDKGTPAAPDVTKVLTVTVVAPAKVYSVNLKGKANQQFEAVRGSFGHEVDKDGNPITTGIYVEEGAEVVDADGNVDTSLTNKLTQTWDKNFDPHTVGSYVTTYTLSDANNPTGGEIKAIRTIKIVDTTKPLISLKGSNAVNVAKGFDINTIFPADQTTVDVDDNASGTISITKTDSTNSGVTTRTFTATDKAGNADTVSMTITELPDLDVKVPNITRSEKETTAIVPQPSVTNNIGNVTYTYSPDISSIDIKTPKKTTVTVTAEETLKYGKRTGTTTFVVEITKFTPDTTGVDWLDGKHIFESNYPEHEGDGVTKNDDQEIETTGTIYQTYVNSSVAANKQPANTAAVWYDEEAMDPYERRIIADEYKKPYVK